MTMLAFLILSCIPVLFFAFLLLLGLVPGSVITINGRERSPTRWERFFFTAMGVGGLFIITAIGDAFFL